MGVDGSPDRSNQIERIRVYQIVVLASYDDLVEQSYLMFFQ